MGLERLGEQLRIPAPAVDAALAAAVAVANGFAIAAEQEAGSKDPDALAYLFGVALAAALLVRQRWPLGVFLVSAVLLTSYHSLDYPAIGLAVPLGVACSRPLPGSASGSGVLGAGEASSNQGFGARGWSIYGA